MPYLFFKIYESRLFNTFNLSPFWACDFVKTFGKFYSRGRTAQQNLDVSQKRAAQVSDALGADGIAAARLESHGLGATNLKIKTGEGVTEPRNRRIEIRLIARPG